MLPFLDEAQTALDWLQGATFREGTWVSLWPDDLPFALLADARSATPGVGCLDRFQAVFVMGHHHLTTVLALASLAAGAPGCPTVISGGTGRGTHFIREKVAAYDKAHETRPPNWLAAMSEAALIKHVLTQEDYPGKVDLEEKASHSQQNCQYSQPKLTLIPGLMRPDAKLAIVQCPTQRYRSLATCQTEFAQKPRYHLPCQLIALGLAPIQLRELPEEDQVIHVFRMVGLDCHRIKKRMDGEREILLDYYDSKQGKDYWARIPTAVKTAYDKTAREFFKLIECSDLYWEIIAPVASDDPAKP